MRVHIATFSDDNLDEKLDERCSIKREQSPTELSDQFTPEVIDALFNLSLFEKYTVNRKRIVSKMPLSIFQQCIVRTFGVHYKQNDIQ